MSKTKPSFDFSLKPSEAIEYLKNKGYKLTFDYDEMMHEAHHKAFTVAKVTRLDLLHDIYSSIDKALEEGQTFASWKKELEPTLKKKGWIGKKEVLNPKTGEVKTITVDGHRLKNIFKTNIRVARSVGRYKQQRTGKLTEYWRYIGGLSENPRDGHLAKNGMVLHRDDPWWSTNYPPNGWGCKCRVRAYSKKQLDKRGWSVAKSGGDNIAQKEWAYDIGEGSKVAKLSKIDLNSSLAKLPKASKNNDYAKLSDAELLATFYKKMGLKKGEMFVDKVGDPMLIDDSLFLDKRSKKLKINKKQRHLLLDEFITTIKDPDEIYIEFDKFGIKKNMFRYLNIDGKKEAILAVFRYFKDKTQGATIFYVQHKLENRREMKLIYQKGESE